MSIGLRPQYLHLNKKEVEVKGGRLEEENEIAFIDAVVISSELLGASRHIKCEYQEKVIVVETASTESAVEGKVRLYFNKTKIHLFDVNNYTISR